MRIAHSKGGKIQRILQKFGYFFPLSSHFIQTKNCTQCTTCRYIKWIPYMKHCEKTIKNPFVFDDFYHICECVVHAVYKAKEMDVNNRMRKRSRKSKEMKLNQKMCRAHRFLSAFKTTYLRRIDIIVNKITTHELNESSMREKITSNEEKKRWNESKSISTSKHCAERDSVCVWKGKKTVNMLQGSDFDLSQEQASVRYLEAVLCRSCFLFSLSRDYFSYT